MTNIPFLACVKIVAIFFITLILISLGFLATKGLQFRLHLRAAPLVEVTYDEALTRRCRELLGKNGYGIGCAELCSSPMLWFRMANSYTPTL